MKLFSTTIILTMLFIAPIFSQDDAIQKSIPTATTGTTLFIGVPSEVQARVAHFFKTLIAMNTELAFDELLSDSPIIEKKEQVEDLIKQTKRSFELYGQIKGFEPVNSDIVTESLMRVRYLALHSKYPMRWIFTFYKSPDKGWIIINIKFDDQAEFFFSDE